MSDDFKEHFSFGSFLAVILFLLGNYIVYLILNGDVSKGVFLMVISLIIYVINNVLANIYGFESSFNDFLENVAVLITFGVSTIVFGVSYYNENPVLLFIILFYAVCLLLSLGRNNVMSLKNSIGWPVPLNGLFFPLVYFFWLFYFNDSQNTIFIFYYVTVGILAVSSYNFLGNIDAAEMKAKHDVRFENFRQRMSHKEAMKKYRELLHHEEIKEQKEKEKIIEELDKVNKSVITKEEVEDTLKEHENKLSKIIKSLIMKFHWIKGRDIPVKREEIENIENDFGHSRKDKIKKDEVKEVFLYDNKHWKEEKEEEDRKRKAKEDRKLLKHHKKVKKEHLIAHHEDIRDIKPEDVKHIPRVPIEDAIAMDLKHSEENRDEGIGNRDEGVESREEGVESREEDERDSFNFESSTFETKKRL